LVENGRPIWAGTYAQLWRQRLSPDGTRIAAVVAPTFGKWTIAVDDSPWKVTYGDCALPPIFSPNGGRVAAIVKDDNRWTIAVDGKPWSETFDMVWDPVFSPNGDKVIAKVENNGQFSIAINGKVWKSKFEALWEPVISPDGTKALVKAVTGGKYYRRIVALEEMIG